MPGKTSSGTKTAHPQVWWASFSGLGGPPIATQEFGAWCSPAKIHTLVTLSQCGKVLGSDQFLRRLWVIRRSGNPTAVARLFLMSSRPYQPGTRPADGQLQTSCWREENQQPRAMTWKTSLRLRGGPAQTPPGKCGSHGRVLGSFRQINLDNQIMSYLVFIWPVVARHWRSSAFKGCGGRKSRRRGTAEGQTGSRFPEAESILSEACAVARQV